MVDVNVNTDVKSFGVPAPPTVTVEERNKPQVAPVGESSDGNAAALDQKALQGRGEEAARQRLDRNQVSKMVDEIQARLEAIGGNLRLAINQDKKSDAIVVQVSERKTGEVIRQIPSEDLLALKKKLEDLVGLLFDEKA